MNNLLKMTSSMICTPVLVVVFCFILVGLGISSGHCADNRRADIEIIVGGRRFDSFEAYKEARQSKFKGLMPALPAIPVKVFMTALFSLTHEFDGAMMGRRGNGAGRQTEEMPGETTGQNARSKSRQQLLQAVSAMSNVGFNTGVIRVINDFQKTGTRVVTYKPIDAKDLENVLSESFPDGGYSGPILVISNKNKLRILTLDSVSSDGTGK